jgi:hypothetical protein
VDIGTEPVEQRQGGDDRQQTQRPAGVLPDRRQGRLEAGQAQAIGQELLAERQRDEGDQQQEHQHQGQADGDDQAMEPEGASP